MSSHFSFSNSLYDECNIKKKNQESTDPFQWITDPLYESKEACFNKPSPFMHNQFRSIPSNAVDIESELRNQTRLLSRCPETRFNPLKSKNCEKCDKCDKGMPCQCNHCKDTKEEHILKDCSSNGLVPEYTRMNKPCNIFSGITINRFHPLCQDAQDMNTIQSNGYIGINTRNQVKDAFKKSRQLK